MFSSTRSKTAAALAVVLIAGSLAGCSSVSSDPDGVTTLNWWTRLGESQQAQAEEFNETHDDIQVKLTQVPDDQYVNKVGTGVRSDNGPDVLDLDDANAPLFAATGILADISDRAQSLDFTEALNPGMVALGTYDGKTYSLPFSAGPSIMLYNKTLFEQAGLPTDKAPSTWEEIKDAATAVRGLGPDIYGFDIPGSCGGCLAYSVQPTIWASGGQTMTTANNDQTTTYATSPQVAETFEFYRDMWDAGLVNPAGQTEAGATWGQDFDAGKVGIIFAGAWLIGPAEEAGYEIGAARIPGKNGDFSTFAGGDNLGIVSSSDKQEAAWTFIEWLLSSEQQTKLASYGQQTPVRSDVVTDDFAAEYPVVSLMVDVSTQSNAPNSIATNALQLSATSPWLAAFQSVVFQGANIEMALEKADADSLALIQQAYESVE